MPSKTFEIPVIEPDITALDWLSRHTNLSKTTLKDAMAKGACWLSEGKSTVRLRRAKRPLSQGSKLFLYYNPEILNTEAPTADCLTETSNWSLWYKPKGMLSQGTKWGDHHCLYRIAEQRLHRPVYPLHRLDRATSGLMLLAHTKKAAKSLSEQFEKHRTVKCYQAIVSGDAAKLKGKTLNPPIDNKAAETRILDVTAQQDSTSLLFIQIRTGRKHQIRKHLTEAGFPIVGDTLYGQMSEKALQLEAVGLGFICPTTDLPLYYCMKPSS